MGCCIHSLVRRTKHMHYRKVQGELIEAEESGISNFVECAVTKHVLPDELEFFRIQHNPCLANSLKEVHITQPMGLQIFVVVDRIINAFSPALEVGQIRVKATIVAIPGQEETNQVRFQGHCHISLTIQYYIVSDGIKGFTEIQK